MSIQDLLCAIVRVSGGWQADVEAQASGLIPAFKNRRAAFPGRAVLQSTKAKRPGNLKAPDRSPNRVRRAARPDLQVRLACACRDHRSRSSAAREQGSPFRACTAGKRARRDHRPDALGAGYAACARMARGTTIASGHPLSAV